MTGRAALRLAALVAAGSLVAVGCIPGDGTFRRIGPGGVVPYGALLVLPTSPTGPGGPADCWVEFEDEGELFRGSHEFDGPLLMKLTPPFTRLLIGSHSGADCVGIPLSDTKAAQLYRQPPFLYVGTYFNDKRKASSHFIDLGHELELSCSFPGVTAWTWITLNQGTWDANCAAVGLD